MTGLKEIDGKYYQECRVVILSTSNKSAHKGQIVMGVGRHLFQSREIDDIGSLSAQHLYITSNEEIKEGDWFYTPIKRSIEQCIKKLLVIKDGDNDVEQYKIIASTDTSLGLPEPSQEFIKVYIEEYNKRNSIDKVLVEYICFDTLNINSIELKKAWNNKLNYIIKTNSSNEISIKELKDSWNREEVDIEIIDFDTWYQECKES